MKSIASEYLDLFTLDVLIQPNPSMRVGQRPETCADAAKKWLFIRRPSVEAEFASPGQN